MDNVELIKEWIELLRSGKFKQGKGALRSRIVIDSDGNTEDRWCCLGVLCELVRQKHPDEFTWHNDADVYHVDHEMSYIPIKIFHIT